MHELNTFISKEFRPNVRGAELDKTHFPRLILSKGDEKISKEIIVNAICFGPKKDNVLINLEHVIKKSDEILILFYEDIHLRWTYASQNGNNFFIYKKNEIEEYIVRPKCLYIRGCYIDPDEPSWTIIGNFFNFVDMGKWKVLCAPKSQLTNESKPFQLKNSLAKAAKKFNTISIGRSYVIKGSRRLSSLQKNKSYIVKSLSGIRSIVSDENEYKKWNTKNLDNLPVLFQEKVIGNDLRAHIINNQTFAKLSLSKTHIDYRYDSNFFNLCDISSLDKEPNDFCIEVAILEKNRMLGIDFIKQESNYVVLEANPSPGWSAYHPYNGVETEPFIEELLKVLRND